MFTDLSLVLLLLFTGSLVPKFHFQLDAYLRSLGLSVGKKLCFCACISVGLPRMLSAYFVCVLSVSYIVSVLILDRKNLSSSAITPCHVLISQNVAHTSDQSQTWCMRVKDLKAIYNWAKKGQSRNFNSGVSFRKPEWLTKKSLREVWKMFGHTTNWQMAWQL